MDELEQHIKFIGQMMNSYQQEYAHVPKIDSKFPQNVTLGEVSYPSDIFSNSIGYTEPVKFRLKKWLIICPFNLWSML